MHVGFVLHCLPQLNTSGDSTTAWILIDTLKKAGHKVALFVLKEAYDRGDSPELRQKVAASVEALHVLDIPPYEPKAGSFFGRFVRQFIAPPLESLFPSAALRAPLAAKIRSAKPDVLFVYHWTAAAATLGYTALPKMIVTGDLAFRPGYCRWRYGPFSLSNDWFKRGLFAWRNRVHQGRAMIKLLEEGEIVGAMGSVEAEWLRTHGEPRSRRFKNPIPDETLERPKITSDKKPYKIITATGNLQSTATSLSLDFLAKELLPLLEKKLGPDAFQIHVIGKGSPPASLEALLPRPTIVMRGYVDSVESEFASSDVMLSITPVFMGFRTRIITAMSFRCCVIAHKYEAWSLPEMKHGENCLIGGSAEELASLISKALSSPEERTRLGMGGRVTYLENFRPEAAAHALVRDMESLVR